MRRRQVRKSPVGRLCFAWLLVAGGAIAPLGADTTTQGQAWRIASKYRGDFTAVPSPAPSQYTQGGPLMGNGDLGVALGGNVDFETYYLGKNEFWTYEATSAQIRAVGRLRLAVAGMSSAASYSATEDIRVAEVRARFIEGADTFETTNWVAATENLLVIAVRNTAGATKTIALTLDVGDQNPYATSTGASGDVLYRDVRADATDVVDGATTLQARVAVRVIGTAGRASGSTLTFTLPAGSACTVITSVLSNRDDASYASAAVASVATRTQAQVDVLKTSHRQWWDAFWARSFVEIPDKTIEKAWYGSLYLMGSASRSGEFTPGLWGPWIAKNMGWRGDFTLNNNFESPFYGPVMANHPELADNYDRAVTDWIPNGQAQAAANGYQGVYYPVHIGPVPNGSLDKKQHNQKFAATLAASPMINQYYMTYDPGYASRIYPYLKEVAKFWESYLYWDGTRYLDLEDSQPEGSAYPQTNGVASLGYIRFVLNACIQISTDLNVDANLRPIWTDILSKLSAYPQMSRQNPNTLQMENVFRVTEVGDDWQSSNSHSVRHIFYGHAFGLEGDPTLLQVGRNTVDQLARWTSTNGTPSFYPAAARVGYNPTRILTELAGFVTSNSYPNLHLHTGAGGLENLHTVPATVGEMLCQSVDNIIRPFSNWPSGTDGKFGDLRAWGAFLVSSERRGGQVLYLRIVSEKGRSLTFRNPWPAATVAVYRNGVAAGTVTGAVITVPTTAGEVLHFATSGTSYQEILNRMDAAYYFEAESLAVRAISTGDTVTNSNDGNLSGGVGSMVNTNAAGDFVRYKLPMVGTGTYSVRVLVKKYTTRGIVQAYVGAAGGTLGALGSTQDLYGPTSYTELTLGNWTIGTTSDKEIELRITGKNPSSSGYTALIDAVRLIPQ
jgi:hypothetical protein